MGVAIDKIVMAALAKRDDKKLCFASIKTGEKVLVDMDDLQKAPTGSTTGSTIRSGSSNTFWKPE